MDPMIPCSNIVWLPVDCVSTIASYTSPQDACILSLVSSSLRSAADSDFVWKTFLPSDHQDIVSRAINLSTLKFSSYKELFHTLCIPLLLDAGNKSFQLEKSSGKKCYILSARELSIAWSTDPMFWCWKPTPESRFAEVVELRTVSWLQIEGKIRTRMLTANTLYTAYLVMNISHRAYGLDSTPSQVSIVMGNKVKRGKAYLGHKDENKVKMETLFYGNRRNRIVQNQEEYEGIQRPSKREDGWMEIQIGEFYIGKENYDEEIKMSLVELGYQLKGGLIIEGIESNMEHLPGDCFAHILSFTSPLEACRASLTSLVLQSMADSDIVWQKFLPHNYEAIVSRLVDSSLSCFLSNKELFMRLCEPQLIDDGNKMFSIEKRTGKICYQLSARQLSIAWGNSPLYWSWKPIHGSRFAEAAELRTICWLEIKCNINSGMLSPKTTYGAYLKVKIAERAYGLDSLPSEVSIEVGNYKSQGTVYIRSHCKSNEKFSYQCNCVRNENDEEWLEIELGSFYTELDEEVRMCLKEVKGVHLKGGLIVDGIELRPK